MAIRVKKLARELSRDSGEVLGLLKTLGYARYKTPNDMLPDPAADAVRQAAARGVRATPVAVSSTRARPKAAAGAPAKDVMAALVPGVVPMGAADAPPRPATAASRPPPPPAPAPAPAPAPEDRAPDLELQGALDEARAQLSRLEQALAAERAALASVRAELEAERDARARAAAQVADDSLLSVFQARGLRGADEVERALASLAQYHELAPWLGRLVVDDPGALLRRLEDRLVLVGGEVPGALDLPAVTVAADRAEVPGADGLRRTVGRLGEQLLLNGLRSALIVGMPLRWHVLVEGAMDPRISLAFEPRGPRPPSRAAQDAASVDVLLGWDLELSDVSREAYEGSRVRLVLASGGSLSGWVSEIVGVLGR